MVSDKLLEFIISSVRKEEEQKYRKEDDLARSRPCNQFWCDVKAGTLVDPSNTKAKHHREREKHYITKLEETEKELREKGVSIEAFDQQSHTYHQFQGSIASGAVSSHSMGFQPRVDQKLMDNVTNAKSKMLEHRDKAEKYEKYAKAFSFNPDFLVRLSVEDVHYFGL